jgi:3-oxoacyl-[acyl-carrier-protein] synthase III
VDPYSTTVVHGSVDFSDAAGTVVVHKEEEQYGTVVVSDTAQDDAPYREALRMAHEQYGSREPSPMGGSVIAHSNMSEASGYMAAIAHANNDAGVHCCASCCPLS